MLTERENVKTLQTEVSIEPTCLLFTPLCITRYGCHSQRHAGTIWIREKSGLCRVCAGPWISSTLTFPWTCGFNFKLKIKWLKYILKLIPQRAGKMAQQLEAHAVCPCRGLGLGSQHTHEAVYNLLSLQLQGSCPPAPSSGFYRHFTCIHTDMCIHRHTI